MSGAGTSGARPTDAGTILRRILRNSTMLVSSKAIAGFSGLAYLAMAGQVLGSGKLGMLILVHSTTIAVREITSFRSWQAFIRYGAEYLTEQNRTKFHSLLRLTIQLDVLASVIGSVLGALLLYHIAPVFGFSADLRFLAVMYCLSTLVALKSSPVGVLRLFGRFDLLARYALVVPAVRTVGAVACWLYGAPLQVFLLVWFLADVASSAVLMILGYRVLRQQPVARHLALRWEPLRAQMHVRIWPFIWSSNLHSTVGIATTHLPVLIAGIMLGPVASAFVKICQEVSGVLAKPAQLLAETIYPELARLVPLNANLTILRLSMRSMLFGGLASLVLLVVVVFNSERLLMLLFGEEYGAAHQLLNLFVFSAGIQLSTFIFEPLLYAQNRPDFVFLLRLLVSAAKIAGMVAVLPYLGVEGVGYTMILAALAVSLGMGAQSLAPLIGRRRKEDDGG